RPEHAVERDRVAGREAILEGRVAELARAVLSPALHRARGVGVDAGVRGAERERGRAPHEAGDAHRLGARSGGAVAELTALVLAPAVELVVRDDRAGVPRARRDPERAPRRERAGRAR